jgi:hypothetical protein
MMCVTAIFFSLQCKSLLHQLRHHLQQEQCKLQLDTNASFKQQRPTCSAQGWYRPAAEQPASAAEAALPLAAQLQVLPGSALLPAALLHCGAVGNWLAAAAAAAPAVPGFRAARALLPSQPVRTKRHVQLQLRKCIFKTRAEAAGAGFCATGLKLR